MGDNVTSILIASPLSLSFLFARELRAKIQARTVEQ